MAARTDGNCHPPANPPKGVIAALPAGTWKPERKREVNLFSYLLLGIGEVIATTRCGAFVIRNILVPTDFSAGSQAAVAYARELASLFGASLHLLHVVENPYAPGGFMESYPHPPGFYPIDVENHARMHLDRCLSADDKVKFRAVLTVTTGVAAQEILSRIAREPKIDLVVLATYGRGGSAPSATGSVADKVLRGSTCPVLTVKDEPLAAAV